MFTVVTVPERYWRSVGGSIVHWTSWLFLAVDVYVGLGLRSGCRPSWTFSLNAHPPLLGSLYWFYMSPGRIRRQLFCGSVRYLPYPFVAGCIGLVGVFCGFGRSDFSLLPTAVNVASFVPIRFLQRSWAFVGSRGLVVEATLVILLAAAVLSSFGWSGLIGRSSKFESCLCS